MKLVIHTTATGRQQLIEVADTSEARTEWVSHRDGGNELFEYLGASDMRGKCGEVRDGEEVVCTIAYNGRIIEGA